MAGSAIPVIAASMTDEQSPEAKVAVIAAALAVSLTQTSEGDGGAGA